MVDDDNVDSQPLRQQNFLLRVDPVVYRNQKVGTSLGELMDSLRTEAIPFVPVGQVGSWLNAQTGENTAQNVRAEHAVAVVVAMDRNPLFLANGGEHAINCLRHARDRCGSGRLLQEGA